MSKKIAVFIALTLFTVLGLFIFGEIYHRAAFPPEEVGIEEIKETELVEEEVPVKEKKESLPQDEPRVVHSPDKELLEGLKRRGARKEKEEFDLTPPIDKLIQTQKERIRPY